MNRNITLRHVARVERQNKNLKALAASTLLLAAFLLFWSSQSGASGGIANRLLGIVELVIADPASIIVIVASVAATAFLLSFAWRIRNRLSGKPAISTQIRTEAAAQATAKLRHAKQLLEEGDHNLEKAIRLRDEVLQKDLPPVGLYIKGQDPRSLLTQLNKRIQGAKSRKFVDAENKKRAAQREALARISDVPGRSQSKIYPGTLNGVVKRTREAGSRKLEELIQVQVLNELERSSGRTESDMLRSLKQRAQLSRHRQQKAMLLWGLAIVASTCLLVWFVAGFEGGGGFHSSFSFLR